LTDFGEKKCKKARTSRNKAFLLLTIVVCMYLCVSLVPQRKVDLMVA